MKDSRHKYLDMAGNFKNRAAEIEMFCKVSNRVCEKLAGKLARVKAKTQDEFEKTEYWKDFVLKSTEQNEKVLELLEYTKGLFEEILQDADALSEGAKIIDTVKFQSETIEALTTSRDKLYEAFRQHTKNPQFAG